MQTFFHWIVVALSMLVYFIAPFAYVLKKGNFKKGVFFTWQLLVLWGLICGVTLLVLVSHEATRQLGIETFPDLPECGLLIMFGWLWGIIISGLAMGVRWLYVKSNPKTLPQ
jgi:hypothetical protein